MPHLPVANLDRQLSAVAMPVFKHLPLGQRIPSSPHAVSCSLPTMRDLRGYEEKKAETMRVVKTGYPRFVVHPFLVRLAEHVRATTPGHADRTLWLTSSARMADALAALLRSGNPPPPAAAVRIIDHDGIHGVSHPAADTDLAARAKTFLQNVGGFLSSRAAEDHLVRLNLATAPFPEQVFGGDAPAEIRRVLRGALPACADRDLFLANSGMNAVYAAFRASAEIQAARGRTVWIQLGWLYLDTIAILQKFTASRSDYVYIRDPLDLAAIERVFTRFGPRIAGIVAELPTNPLIQTPDLPAIGELCRQHGAHLLVDPSVASVFCVDVLRHADAVVSSLTKYTASEGDILAGLVAINPAARDADALRSRTAALLEPAHSRDLARLAAEIGETEVVVDRINANAARVAAFLSTHPKVRDVFWAQHPASRENFQKIARKPNATGGMISFALRVPMEPVYDRLRLPKGPSFGMKTTLICPFIYLAHYDLVSTPAGIAELAASRIDPELLRLCVGTELPEEIIDALAEALG